MQKPAKLKKVKGYYALCWMYEYTDSPGGILSHKLMMKNSVCIFPTADAAWESAPNVCGVQEIIIDVEDK